MQHIRYPQFYYHMATTWLFVILVGAIVSAYFRYKSCIRLYELSLVSGEVQAARNGKQTTVGQTNIVPGDLVHLQPGKIFCDVVIICADNLIVEESSLTGEGVPVPKFAIVPDQNGHEYYNRTDHKMHTILAGTTILEAEDAVAVVIATSSYSTRGTLLREIFSQERHLFKFDVEIPIILSILTVYAVFCFTMVVYFLQSSPVYGWFYGM
jgi:cation-transporting P-type ATPase 13A2